MLGDLKHGVTLQNKINWKKKKLTWEKYGGRTHRWSSNLEHCTLSNNSNNLSGLCPVVGDFGKFWALLDCELAAQLAMCCLLLKWKKNSIKTLSQKNYLKNLFTLAVYISLNATYAFQLIN